MSENVRDYVIAAAKLYGMVPVNKVVEIYNTQNEDQITNKDLRRIVRKYQPYDCFAFIKDDHVVWAAADVDLMPVMLEIKKGKPYYIPKKDEFLKYTDQDYVETTREFEELQRFLKTCFLVRKRRAVEFSKEIRHCCRSFITFHDLMSNYWAQRRFNIRNRLKAQEFLYLLTNLRYNTRAWELSGHTLTELAGVMSKKEIEGLLSYGLDENYFPAINRPGG